MEYQSQPHLQRYQRVIYGFGHVFNDLCSAMWFSYFLVYLHYIAHFRNTFSGYIILLGQVVDAISTPLVGYESDRISGFCNYGKRKSWHFIGTTCVTCSFAFLFMRCINCSETADWSQFIYYSPFVTIFQFGWAATQISHLSLIPHLTSDESIRVELNSFRNAATLLSIITVNGLVLAFFGSEKTTKWSDADSTKFMILAFIITGIGLTFSTTFHIVIKEPNQSTLSYNAGNKTHVAMKWYHWLTEYQFYLVAVLYMFARLTINVTQTYWVMYLTETLELMKIYITVIPLVVFLSGFFLSLLTKPLNNLLGRKLSFIVGLLTIAAGSIWIMFVPKHSLQIFGPAILNGAGGSVLLITALSTTADLIGSQAANGAFVFGSMSFTDKLSSGAAILLIQIFHPCSNEACCSECARYYHHVMSILPLVFVGTAFLFVLIISPMTIGDLRHLRVTSVSTETEENSPLLSQDSSNINNAQQQHV